MNRCKKKGTGGGSFGKIWRKRKGAGGRRELVVEEGIVGEEDKRLGEEDNRLGEKGTGGVRWEQVEEAGN